MGFSRQEYWSGLLFSSPMCKVGGLKFQISARDMLLCYEKSRNLGKYILHRKEGLTSILFIIPNDILYIFE